jgi:hypothetical protein
MILDNFDYCNPFYRIFSLITLSRDRHLIPKSKTASVNGSRFIFKVTTLNMSHSKKSTRILGCWAGVRPPNTPKFGLLLNNLVNVKLSNYFKLLASCGATGCTCSGLAQYPPPRRSVGCRPDKRGCPMISSAAYRFHVEARRRHTRLHRGR